MLKVLLWIVSNDGRFFQNAINTLGRQHNGVEIVGFTAIEECKIDVDGKNVPVIPPNEIEWENVDVLLVVGAKQIGMSKVTQAARLLNFHEEKLLGDWIACIPGFTLEKYRQLQNSCLSILAMNCFGGEISNTLGLPFRSPIINMFFNEKDYLSFLRKPQAYMEEKLVFKGTKFETNLKFDYPVVMLGDVEINMNHYPYFDVAVEIWERRKARINWKNLFVTMYTEREDILQEFDALPYNKKACFVPFKSNLNSAWFIITKNVPLWMAVNRFGFGNPFFYDPFDMLLYGKKTPLIDM